MKKTSLLSRVLKEGYRAHPVFFYIMGANAIFGAATTLFNIYALKIILDAVVSEPLLTSLAYASIIVGIDVFLALLKQLFDKLLDYHSNMTAQRLRENMAIFRLKVVNSTCVLWLKSTNL